MKNIIVKILLSISVFSSIVSCTKEVTLNIQHEPKTVIYGSLSNLNEKVSIQIRQTVPVNATENYKSINNANVFLYEKSSSGTTQLVTDEFSVVDGTYTSNATVATTIGHSYWIEVDLADGTHFKSAEETLLPIVPITEVVENETNLNEYDVTFSDPSEVSNYYKLSAYLYKEGHVVLKHFVESNDIVFNGDADATLSINVFDNLKANQSVPEYDTKQIRLESVNYSSFQFLLNQRAQIEANGNSDVDDGDSGGDPSLLFATPPVSLQGNITNTTTNKLALGNFTITTIDSKTVE